MAQPPTRLLTRTCRFDTGPRMQNIPMPSTPEGDRLRALCREILLDTYPGIRTFVVDYEGLELQILAGQHIAPDGIYKESKENKE